MSFRRGGAAGGNQRQALPFGLAYTDVSEAHETEFPSIPLPVNNPMNDTEKSIALNYINLNNVINDGPFHTGTTAEASQDNGSIERYSDKYSKKKNVGTVSIDDFPFHIQNFPSELYNVMGINKKKKKTLLLSKSKMNELDIFTGAKTDGSAINGLSMLEKFKELAEDAEDDNDNEKKDNEDENVVSDNNFDDDEDDDDDYNAEKYFDDGDDDGYGNEDDYGDEPAF
ncbi:hypothetical protein KAFR_0J02330 [Kazachstania africana CBS 2517]|uniref:DNA-directed RNA polymerase III subunit n=1 Tax=Kazachstania africana (strain ATCC 22294 / BCRC 22015 / CBS 2517 / CECT 1963 / NBRC 1671 / NRRL Y-8276) TaxID=1071382 RepID=H2B0Z7_KAZAF|nr:hypothetical protein KAFR_0J02330 [Kazachstania africana CBS 2517]CCF60297.1 hypothetical protein KAFR_0J02330 [Kazachstania africana CBS 2517]